MADITMCQDEKCPMKGTCYRQTAPVSSHWQSYFMGSPREEDTCPFYWPDKEDSFE